MEIKVQEHKGCEACMAEFDKNKEMCIKCYTDFQNSKEELKVEAPVKWY